MSVHRAADEGVGNWPAGKYNHEHDHERRGQAAKHGHDVGGGHRGWIRVIG